MISAQIHFQIFFDVAAYLCFRTPGSAIFFLLQPVKIKTLIQTIFKCFLEQAYIEKMIVGFEIIERFILFDITWQYLSNAIFQSALLSIKIIYFFHY